MWALLPVKDLNAGKSRLASVLPPADRHTLMAAMLTDLLTTLAHCPGITASVVVTRCPDAQRIASAHGARVLSLLEDNGLNEAVAAGIATLTAEAVQHALILHADIPMATADDINAVIEQHTTHTHDVTVVPDHEHNGTNVLAVRLPTRLPFCYGPHSYTAHCDAASRLGLRIQTLENARLGMDLDLWEDVARLYRASQDTVPSQLRTWLAQHPELAGTSTPIA